MNLGFADTFFFLAILNPRDSAHATALAVSVAFPGRIVTTQWVLIEVADALSDPRDRSAFVAFLQVLEADSKFTIVPATDESFRRGLELYGNRFDKDWSLTDCTSFVVMHDLDVTEALTGDQHFRQAGFTTLL